MSSRAETIKAEHLCLPCQNQGTPADQAGAKQWREGDILPLLTQVERIIGVGNGRSREAAVSRIAGEKRAIAKIFAASCAVETGAAGAAQPGNADALAQPQVRNALAEGLDATDNLVARRNRKLRLPQVPIHHMQISAAYTAGRHPNPYLARARLGQRQNLLLQGPARPPQDHGAHRA